ncbi:MAG: site-specific integrase [Acidobacteriota bacterium]
MRYTAGLWIHGKQKTKAFRRKADAVRWLRETACEVDSGQYQEFKKTRFSDWVEEWCKEYLPDKALRTQETYLSIVKLHLLPYFGDRELTSITFKDLNHFVKDRRRNGSSHNSALNMLRCLSCIFHDALCEQLVRSNPVKDPRRKRIPKKPRLQRDALTRDEVRALLEVVEGRDRAMLMVALLAGLRRGEAMGLEWRDIDFDGMAIRIERQCQWCYTREINPGQGWFLKDPKSEAGKREIDMSPVLRRELYQWHLRCGRPAGEQRVFQSIRDSSRPVTIGTVQLFMQKAVESASVRSEISYHWLRHTFGSLKLRQGEDVAYVSKQMGHSSVNVTLDIYCHVIDKSMPAAAAKTDELLFGDGAITPKKTTIETLPRLDQPKPI